MNKAAYIIVTIALVIGIATIFFATKQDPKTGESAQNIETIDNVQYITIQAKGGYSPAVSSAQGGIPTKLIVKTDGTYDCSASLVIRAIGFQKILAQTGEEVIDLGTPKAGQSLQGLCGMGMYNFKINFS